MKFDEGENRFRILTDARIGWEGWKDGSPFRREGVDCNIEEDEVDIDEKYDKPKINHFWAFSVFDYADKKIKILTLTQKTVMKAIQGLVDDPDWGDPQKYDISVEKIKKGQKTSYSVKSYPHKALPKDIAKLVSESKIDLDSLFREPGEEEEDDFTKKQRKAARSF